MLKTIPFTTFKSAAELPENKKFRCDFPVTFDALNDMI